MDMHAESDISLIPQNIVLSGLWEAKTSKATM